MIKKTDKPNESLIALADKLRTAVENDDIAFVEATEAEVEQKLQALAFIMKELDARQDSLRDIADDYASKAGIAKARKEQLRNYATACMRTAFGIAAGKPIPEEIQAKFKGVATIWLATSPVRLVGNLASLLAEEEKMQDEQGPGYIHPYIIREPKPNNEAIKAAIAIGVEVGDYALVQDNHLRYN
jgi:hypothetical protein